MRSKTQSIKRITQIVIPPAEAGIQSLIVSCFCRDGIWIPVFTGMTCFGLYLSISAITVLHFVFRGLSFSLYKKTGFEIEGTKKHSFLIDGSYIDEYYMAKLL